METKVSNLKLFFVLSYEEKQASFLSRALLTCGIYSNQQKHLVGTVLVIIFGYLFYCSIDFIRHYKAFNFITQYLRTATRIGNHNHICI